MSAILKYFSPQALPYHQDKKRHGREEAQARVAYSSRCIYVGNLAFVTTDVQLYTLFSQCGSIERVIMGINRHTKQPIGFAYVIFVQRESAMDAVNNLHGTMIDEKILKVEIDKGYHEGKEYGRGSTGAQVRDEHRTHYDELRGGIILNPTTTTTSSSTLSSSSSATTSSSPSNNQYNNRGGYTSRKFNNNNNNYNNNRSNNHNYNNNNNHRSYNHNNNHRSYHNNNYNGRSSQRYPSDHSSNITSSTRNDPYKEEKQYTSRDNTDNRPTGSSSSNHTNDATDDYMAHRGEKRSREEDGDE